MDKQLICIITDKPFKQQMDSISSKAEVKVLYSVDASCTELLEQASIILLVPERFYRLFEYDEIIPKTYRQKCLCVALDLPDWRRVKEKSENLSYWIFYDLFSGRELAIKQLLNILCPEEFVISVCVEDIFALLENESFVVMKGYKDEAYINLKEEHRVLLAHVSDKTDLNDMSIFYDQIMPELISIACSEESKIKYTLLIGKGKRKSEIQREHRETSSNKNSGLTPVLSIALIFVGIVLIYLLLKDYICRGIVLERGVYVSPWIMTCLYFLAAIMVLLHLENRFLTAFCNMQFRRVLGYMLTPTALCCGWRMLLEGFEILAPVMVLGLVLYLKKQFSKGKRIQKKKKIHKIKRMLNLLVHFGKISLILLSILFCVKEVAVRGIALLGKWTIHANEYKVEDFASLEYYEDLSFYQKLKLSKMLISNELYMHEIEEPVSFTVDNHSKSEMLGFYNYESHTIALELKCVEKKEDQQVLDTTLHEVHHLLQYYWMQNEEKVELANSEREMLAIMRNEADGIYIEELDRLEDKYAQYYHSLTEYSSRKYAQERGRYYRNLEPGKDAYILPAAEYAKWFMEIPGVME